MDERRSPEAGVALKAWLARGAHRGRFINLYSSRRSIRKSDAVRLLAEWCSREKVTLH